MPFNLALVNEAIARALPNREALVFRNRRFTHAQLAGRSRRLANFLAECGIGLRQERSQLENWQSGQDHVALYLYNGNEYIESIFGALKARASPFNVNFRYVAEELAYLLENAETKAIIFHACFAPILADLLAQNRNRLSGIKLLIQVKDASDQPLLPGAYDYETVIKQSSAVALSLPYSADDIYLLYTGGTTGMPKGVLWRQADVLATLLGSGKDSERRFPALKSLVARAERSRGMRYLPTPPFMHGTAQWNALSALCGGNTVVIQNNVRSLDAVDLLGVIEAERINVLSLVGDAFGRPILDELTRRNYNLDSLTHILNSGAALSDSIKLQLLEFAPNAEVVDTIGASETGPQAVNITHRDDKTTHRRYRVADDNVVLSEDRQQTLQPGHEGFGWLAKSSVVPLGYLNDPEKSQQTFPEIDGLRYSLPGDRVRLLDTGEIEFQGRDAAMINSGGEKIFAEEVEHALRFHPDVIDVVVTSRPSERWGNEVVAIVQLREAAKAHPNSLLAECEKHLARYKLPKAFLFVDSVRRGANGKIDYRWASSLVTGSLKAAS